DYSVGPVGGVPGIVHFCELLAASLPPLFGVKPLPEPVCLLHPDAGCKPGMVEAPHRRAARLCFDRGLCCCVFYSAAEDPPGLSSGGTLLEEPGKGFPVAVVDDDVRFPNQHGPDFYQLANGNVCPRAVWREPAGL